MFALRKCNPDGNRIYVTFDDGPSAHSSEAVLKILEKHQAQATFFVVGTLVERNPGIFREIVARGHAIGDHSWDHGYRNFFRTDSKLESWIEYGRKRLEDRLGKSPVGFRPPAGVVTPPLLRVLKKLQVPLILWNRRYFDKVFAWRERRANQAARTIRPGDILLLHDAQKKRNSELFLPSLDLFLSEVRERRLSPSPLPQDLLANTT